jgi:molybdopterin-guanine dinucleotide biosynthesis protein A
MSIPAIVLAGERPGGNVLARHFGLSSGVLVEVAGRSCIRRVLETLAAASSVDGGRLSGPDEATLRESDEIQALVQDTSFSWSPPQSGPAESVLSTLATLPERPVLLTAADHALLTPEIVDNFCNLTLRSDADFIVGLVPYSRVRGAFPDSKRTVLKFSDGEYCGSNLFMIRTHEGARLLEFWKTIAQHRKKPWRMAREIGISTLLGYLTGRLTLARALQKISEKSGCRVAHVEVLAPRAAVDVDSIADHALAERVLSKC